MCLGPESIKLQIMQFSIGLFAEC